MALGCAPSQVCNIFLFPKIVSFKSFCKLLGSSRSKFIILNINSRLWRIKFVLKHSKLPKHYNQIVVSHDPDNRSFDIVIFSLKNPAEYKNVSKCFFKANSPYVYVITQRVSSTLRIQSKCGKIRPRKLLIWTLFKQCKGW